ncbi:lysine N(6)-hydroxylase/L-ornithine N(5)-oxygenase family protein [Glutamicibacter arilaitensis]|uniref:L-lysine N6-monooxygenase MbtG n=2 Tax=Glutamicibacter arilaitensis TaxID=256701 RepID=A0A2N7RXI9_9MICC|nr:MULTISPECIES: SidA/IucD/PvdA family monooxygenase [Glutamicibacter]PMQ18598.1 L-lysine 6-monooxygenase [Glutamicibacter arilaitensis]WPR64504.1 SidA/IucD/PvdA family monooxygenase [Glutamicibacter protophormiae]WPR67998.1 SidA/IucD/PvdA family monooxygenase [Glutamicibacter protophormiae]CBT77486.1 possible L-ornithine 5-monooxygenase [Glutamicibacter arilaitensis Re117]HCJ53036.1 L-lysine 6-monooxygenase [Glutamicibacter sp.]
MSRPEITADQSYDVVGLGFGPSNMALATAIHEHNRAVGTEPSLKALFLDRASEPGWHKNLLFEDASMQVAFAKDLASFRNPTSELTFMNFLHTQGRLEDFFNRGSMAPLRIEFVAYLRWAAEQLSDYVRYSSEVVRVVPRTSGGRITGYEVDIADESGVRTVAARHVVLAGGLQPVFPSGVRSGARVWHSAEFLERAAVLDTAAVRSVAVIGGGQSAAEVIEQMYHRCPQAQIHSVISRFGLIPSDASAYANRIFDPLAVDELYAADPQVRQELTEAHRNTNNSVVNPNTIAALYDLEYRDKWLGAQRLNWHRAARVDSVREDYGTPGVQLGLDEGLGDGDGTLEVDVAIFATGYRALDPTTLLGSHAGMLVRDDLGRPTARRDYSAHTVLPDDAKLFLVGQTEHQHGISATLLSNVAVRAGEILDSILAAGTDTAQPSEHRKAHA